MKPRLLYIASRWPYPVRSGRTRMIAQALEIASEVYEVTLAAFDAPDGTGDVPAHVAEVVKLTRPKVGEIALNLAASPTSPLQSHLFASSSARRVLLDWVAGSDPDVVVTDMIRLSGYGRHLRAVAPRARIVLDMDDLLSDRYRQMRASPGDILGSFASGMPGAIRRAASFLPSTILALESVLASRAEERAVRDMDAVIMVSGKEARTLRSRVGDGSRIFDVPPSVPVSPFVDRDLAGGPRFVFFGDETYAPNAEALLIFDAIASRFPGTKFQAAGRLSPKVRTSNVERLGFVGDLDAFLGPDAIMVAPIMTGTGIKTKLLDAFGRGVPVITTPKGIEGIDLDAERDVLLASDLDGFVSIIAGLVSAGSSGVDSLNRIGRSAHASVNLAHSPDRVRSNLLAALRG